MVKSSQACLLCCNDLGVAGASRAVACPRCDCSYHGQCAQRRPCVKCGTPLAEDKKRQRRTSEGNKQLSEPGAKKKKKAKREADTGRNPNTIYVSDRARSAVPVKKTVEFVRPPRVITKAAMPKTGENGARRRVKSEGDGEKNEKKQKKNKKKRTRSENDSIDLEELWFRLEELCAKQESDHAFLQEIATTLLNEPLFLPGPPSAPEGGGALDRGVRLTQRRVLERAGLVARKLAWECGDLVRAMGRGFPPGVLPPLFRAPGPCGDPALAVALLEAAQAEALENALALFRVYLDPVYQKVRLSCTFLTRRSANIRSRPEICPALEKPGPFMDTVFERLKHLEGRMTLGY